VRNGMDNMESQRMCTCMECGLKSRAAVAQSRPLPCEPRLGTRLAARLLNFNFTTSIIHTCSNILISHKQPTPSR